MEQFKIDQFREENNGVSFPDFKSLSERECEEIRQQVCEALGFPANLVGASLSTQLTKLQSYVDGVNAENENFELQAIAKSICIGVQEKVFVNWHQFDKIDQLSFENLAKYFSDIWYPSTDDIDIFDSSLLWIISIDHHGEIQIYCPEQNKGVKDHL